MTKITAKEAAEISAILEAVAAVDKNLSEVLIGDLPIYREDGLSAVGHVKQQDDYTWAFVLAEGVAS